MRRLLITGASSGIGRAVAIAASAGDWQVFACGRDETRLSELGNHSDAIKTLAFDLTDLDACRQALSDIQPDVVLLNAGNCEYVDTDSWEAELFQRVFKANIFSVANTLEVILPQLKPGSQLVFVDSLARLLPFARSEAYGASKAALHYLAKSLDVDLRPRRISVQTVSPGFVRTPLTDKNDFGMPMLIEPETAAASILLAIKRRKPSTYFPTAFAMIIRTLAQLPAALQAMICVNLAKNSGARS